MAEKLWACPEHVRQHALQEALKSLPVCWWDAVPGLGRATVQIVHTGQIHVLSVPAYGNMPCLYHAEQIVQQCDILHLYPEDPKVQRSTTHHAKMLRHIPKYK